MEMKRPAQLGATSRNPGPVRKYHDPERRQTLTQPATFILDESGRIIKTSEYGEQMFGFGHGELQHLHICHLFPQLSESEFVKNGKMNPLFAFLSRSGYAYHAITRGGKIFNCEVNFVELAAHANKRTYNLIVRLCQGITA